MSSLMKGLKPKSSRTGPKEEKLKGKRIVMTLPILGFIPFLEAVNH